MRSSFSMAVGPLLAAFVVTAAPARADSLVVELSGVRSAIVAIVGSAKIAVKMQYVPTGSGG
jgi:hypothetical protein